MINICRARKLVPMALFLLGLGSFVPGGRVAAYVLPSQQLLQAMAPHFSKFTTLVITQTVERESVEGVRFFGETLTMKSPDFLHAASMEPEGNVSRIVDRSFRTLFLSSTPARIENFLRGAGVDTERVSYTRVEGTVAYLIGAGRSGGPIMAVEKARSLPLLFSYTALFAHGPESIRVIFRDYRQVEEGWYPFEILVVSAAGWKERYALQSIRVNVAVELSSTGSLPMGNAPTQKDEAIQGIIQKFEQQYGQ